MSVQNDPDARITAHDAEVFMETYGSAAVPMVKDLIELIDLKVVAVIRINAPIGYLDHVTIGADDEDAMVLDHWVRGLIKHSIPTNVMAIDGVILIVVRDDGVVDIATWGANGNACSVLRKFLPKIFDQVSVSPFQTRFGWSKGGVPTKIKASEWAKLSDAHKAFVAENTHPDAVEDEG